MPTRTRRMSGKKVIVIAGSFHVQPVTASVGILRGD